MTTKYRTVRRGVGATARYGLATTSTNAGQNGGQSSDRTVGRRSIPADGDGRAKTKDGARPRAFAAQRTAMNCLRSSAATLPPSPFQQANNAVVTQGLPPTLYSITAAISRPQRKRWPPKGMVTKTTSAMELHTIRNQQSFI